MLGFNAAPFTTIAHLCRINGIAAFNSFEKKAVVPLRRRLGVFDLALAVVKVDNGTATR